MASWPSVDATSVFSLTFATAKKLFSFARFCFVLHRDFLNSYARQTVSHWTGSKVPATRHGIAYRSLHHGKAGSQAKFLGQAQATQQVPCFTVASFHTLAMQKNKTFTLANALYGREEEKAISCRKNLALLSFLVTLRPYRTAPPGMSPGFLLPGGWASFPG